MLQGGADGYIPDFKPGTFVPAGCALLSESDCLTLTNLNHCGML